MKHVKRPVRPPAAWSTRLSRLLERVARRNGRDLSYLRANCRSIQRVTDGLGPDSDTPDSRAGARVVMNLSSAHVPAFCESQQKPYKNCYDLIPYAAARGLPIPVSEKRKLVDAALPLPAGIRPEQVYFGAVELNGGGIRFYGDICLVLARESVSPTDVVLDRNSYDILRSPAKEQVEIDTDDSSIEARRKRMLRGWSGALGKDIGTIAAIKAIGKLSLTERRWTTGQMSEAIRDDEDYIEVLKMGSFGPRDLQEARISAADSAHDALVGSRLSRKPLPRLESLIWRNRRSRAEAALRAVGVTVRIVTTSGRTKD